MLSQELECFSASEGLGWTFNEVIYLLKEV